MSHVRRLALLTLVILATVVPALATPVVKIQTVKESKPKNYKIAVQLPQFVTPTAAQKAINGTITRYTNAMLAEFSKDSREAAADDPRGWDLEINVHTKCLSDHWFSYEEIGGDYRGGAHPSPIFNTYTYDVRGGRELSLASLFSKGAPYLQTLSDLGRKQLATRDLNSDKDWVAKGSAPTAENYKVWYIDGKNLVVVYPAYQVAPYSSGPQEIKIPYGQLKAIANPQGPLNVP